MTVPYCRIGRFELHPESGLLLDGVPVKLGGRAFDLLLALVARAGQIVPKEALMDAVWPSLTVADNNLTVQCAALRRELARGFPAGQVVIETVPGRGYRLTVTPLGRPESAAQLGNLPAPVTRLIGRESDVAAIGMGLARARLLTVLGIGGIGKTTVAIAAARAAWGAFPDGIWFVGLGAHADPNLVPAAVAASLGINTRRGTSLADVLAALRDQRALLLLDNCEHLIGGVAHTAEALLGGCPALRLLATSREPLAATGETVLRLAPLGLDGAAPALELFLDRAAAACDGMAPEPKERAVCAEICRRLDGIPLAIELAASRLRQFTPAQILTRLDGRFDFLVGGRRAAEPRQQTLRATLDWSYDLLEPDARMLLRRLSVFSGGFCAEAASAVAQQRPTSPAAMESQLASLVDRSLLTVDPFRPDPRYSLLETMRQYALEQAAAAAEPDLRPRLAAWLATALEAAHAAFDTMEERAWTARYAPEVDNLRLALGWAFTDGDAALGVRLAGLGPPLWEAQVQTGEQARWIELALARVGPETPPRDAARLWLARAQWHTLGDQRPLAAAQRAAALFREAGDAGGEAEAQLLAAFSLLSGPETAAKAVQHLDAAAANLGSRPLGRRAATLHRLRGIALWFDGQRDAAWPEFARATTICHDIGDISLRLRVAGSQAQRLFAEHRTDEAERGVAEALAAVPHSFARSAAAIHVSGLRATYLIALGRLHEGAHAARDALRAAWTRGLREELPWGLERCAAVGLDTAPEEAARLLGYNDATYAALGRQRLEGTATRYTALQQRLRERIASDRVAALQAEGATWTAETAVRHALVLVDTIVAASPRGDTV